MSRTSATFGGITYANGKIPKSLLGKVDGRHGTSRTKDAYLRKDAAAALNRCRAEGEAVGLAPLYLRGWYRSLDEQIDVLLRGSTLTPNGRDTRRYGGRTYYLTGAAIATPGYSNHGLALAIDADDFGTVGDWTNPHQLAWTPYLEKHGFTATEGRSIGEPWHRVYEPTKDRSKDTTTPPAQTKDWFDMATKKDLEDAVLAALNSPKGRDAIARGAWTTDGVIPAPADTNTKKNPYWTGAGLLKSARSNTLTLTAKVEAQAAVMDALAKSAGLDPADVRKTVATAVDKALAGLSITLTTDGDA